MSWMVASYTSHPSTHAKSGNLPALFRQQGTETNTLRGWDKTHIYTTLPLLSYPHRPHKKLNPTPKLKPFRPSSPFLTASGSEKLTSNRAAGCA